MPVKLTNGGNGPGAGGCSDPIGSSERAAQPTKAKRQRFSLSLLLRLSRQVWSPWNQTCSKLTTSPVW